MPDDSKQPTAGDIELIGGSFSVDLSRPLPGAGGGLPAFVAQDRSGGRLNIMAVEAQPGAPARAKALTQMLVKPIEGLLSPVAQGPARNGAGGLSWFVICQAPPGAALMAASPSGGAGVRPWGEADLLEFVLRPTAHVLEQLRVRHLTHRAIRPDNLFRAGPGEPVLLGTAWAAPPAFGQGAIYEPAYSAVCLPGGRGDGSIADDVYALGVTLLVLALGRVPLAGLDDAAVVQRKLELGSFAALAGEERLPPAIADLARGMLAEDPEHRPPPALLADPAAARARRVAARPPRRAQRPLEVGTLAAWTARTLAQAMASDFDQGVRLLRSGNVERWIRRSLGDAALASRLEEVVRLRANDSDGEDQRADALLTMRAVAVLDPLAPLCWRGVAVWPDGIGAALAAQPACAGAEGGEAETLGQIVAHEAVVSWSVLRAERCDPTALRNEVLQHRTLLRLRGWIGGMPRLRYALNPLLACRSPLLAGQMVVRLSDLLPALERVARQGTPATALPIDQDITAFVAARSEQRMDADLAPLADRRRADEMPMAVLKLLADLQARFNHPPVPGVAAWLVDQVKPMLAAWQSKSKRAQRERALADVAQAGQLAAMRVVLVDPPGLAEDRRQYQAAQAAVQEIDSTLARIAAERPVRAETARRLSQELVAGIGAVALTVAAVAAVMR